MAAPTPVPLGLHSVTLGGGEAGKPDEAPGGVSAVAVDKAGRASTQTPATGCRRGGVAERPQALAHLQVEATLLPHSSTAMNRAPSAPERGNPKPSGPW